MAQNPFINPFSNPNFHYQFWSWLGSFLAWLLGATTLKSLCLFHLAFSFAFSLLFIKAIFSWFPDQLARTSLVLFSVLPVSATAYFWVGHDSITLFLMVFSLAYPRKLPVIFLAGIALGSGLIN
ncbi:MAG: hypothetical protein ACR65R_14325 [Methylomicrobium sp.]